MRVASEQISDGAASGAWLSEDGPPGATLELADGDAIAGLRTAFNRVGFSETAIRVAIGEQALFELRLDEIHVLARRLPDAGSFATLVRVFLLGLGVRASELRDALAPLALDDLARIGLLLPADDGEVSAAARIRPYRGAHVTSDWPASWRTAPRDYVAGISPGARSLDALTVRDEFGSVLNIGAGSGVQALLAASHGWMIVATDVNERALNYTAFGAALSGLTNVESRAGNILDPVGEAERFGLIISHQNEDGELAVVAGREDDIDDAPDEEGRDDAHFRADEDDCGDEGELPAVGPEEGGRSAQGGAADRGRGLVGLGHLRARPAAGSVASAHHGGGALL